MGEASSTFRVIIIGAGSHFRTRVCTWLTCSTQALPAYSQPKPSKRVPTCSRRPSPSADVRQQGIHCVVFEQDASLAGRPRDWNFGIYWAQAPLDECLPEHLSRLVESAQVGSRAPSAADFLPIYNGQSGELMKKVPAPYNIRLHRGRFLRLISTGIDIRVYSTRHKNAQSES